MRKKHFPFSYKVLTALCASIIGFYSTSSLTAIYAWEIPGYTIPYDPPNYYNPTTVSIPDSKPSYFTMMDLERQQGSVYDYTRHMKEIIVGNNYSTWINFLADQLGIEALQMKHVSDNQKEKVLSSYTESMNQILHGKATLPDQSDLFTLYTVKHAVSVDYKTHTEQAKALDEGYQSYAISAQQHIDNLDGLDDNLNQALSISYNAEGEEQARQAEADIVALKNLALVQLTTIMGERSKLQALHQQAENYHKQEVRNNELNRPIYFFDPYDKEDRKMLDSISEHSDFKLYESKGMPDFK